MVKKTPIKKVKATGPRKADEGPEIELATTRTAKVVDRKSEGTEPEEVLGMSKIGVTTETKMTEAEVLERRKEEAPELEVGPEEGTEPPEDATGPMVLPPLSRMPVQERDREQEEGRSSEEDGGPLPPIDDLDEAPELEEVTIGGGSRKVKVLRIKPSMLPPEPEPFEDEDMEIPEEDIVPDKAGPRGGGITDLTSMGSEEGRKGRRRGSGISSDAGLGLKVDLDEASVRRLSAPLLPQEFRSPRRLFHRQFRRNILFLILPAALLFVVFAYVGPSTFAILAIVLIFVAVLAMLFIYGISPFYMDHVVTKRAIILKQGLYFSANIPLDEVRTVRSVEPRVGRLGIYKKHGGKLHIATDRDGYVEIELRSPRKVGSVKGVNGIFLTVEEPAAFVRTVKGAIRYMHEGEEGPSSHEDEL